MPRRLSVGDVMHRGVITCRPETRALAVVRMMAAHRVHSAVVSDREREPRLVDDGDIARALRSPSFDTLTAAGLAQRAALVKRPDSLSSALRRMREAGSTHAVVVDRSNTPVGVVSILDVAEAVLSARDAQ